MKKSEFLAEFKVIFDYIADDNIPAPIYEKMVDIILRLGMKPPFSEKVYKTQMLTHIEPNGYDWDPEDV
jgi:hypothetical protein